MRLLGFLMRVFSLSLLLSGCAVTNSVTPKWEWIGITSTQTHNVHVEESQKFMQDTVKNQSRIVEIVNDINQEVIYIAKREKDQHMLERSYMASGKIQHAKAVSQELSAREFTKAPDPPFDWSSIIQMALASLGVGGPLGALAMSQRGKIKEIAKVAIENGKSTEVNDTAHLHKHI